MWRADWIRPGAAVIDVGTNKVTDSFEAERLLKNFPARLEKFRAKGSVLVGDVHPDAVNTAGALTPVPGGVGPMTITMLMSNTVKAARLRRAGRGTAAGRCAPGEFGGRRGVAVTAHGAMLRLGLTGGIASGKSAVAGMLRELGFEVLDADSLGHTLIEPGTAGI